MNTVKVSVVMPCYNDGKYIAESVESVTNQDLEDWELIIIDDGSDDKKTLSMLKKLAHQSERIHIIRTKHVGVSAARNLAIEKAAGMYILPLDADDLIDKTYLRKAASVLDDDSSVGIVYCQAQKFGKINLHWDLPAFSMKEMLYSNIIFVTSMFRKSDWEKIGGFDKNMIYGLEDYDFWLSILELGRKVVQLPETLFFYRIKSVSRSTNFQEESLQHKSYIYEYLTRKHENLYTQYAGEIIPYLRNKMIEQEHRFYNIKKKIPLYNYISKHENLKKFIKKRLLK